MTVRNPPGWLDVGSHPAAQDRLIISSLLGASPALFAGGAGAVDPGHGIVLPGDLEVTANGTPNMTVWVAAGTAFIHGNEAAYQGVYHFINDAPVQLTIPAADPTNPRRDLIVAQVRDAGGGYSGSSNDARLLVVSGTPAGSPSDPSLAAVKNALVLARIQVNPSPDAAIVTGDITDLRRVVSGVGAPVGTILDYAGAVTTEAPVGWLLCAGQAVSRTTYAGLFTVIGTTFGVGDGSTTFNLPDLRGRVGVGLDNMGGSDSGRLDVANTLGGNGGAQKHTLTIPEIPSHDHNLNFNTGAGAGAALANPVVSTPPHVVSGGYVAAAGGGGAHNNMQPYLLLNKLIKV